MDISIDGDRDVFVASPMANKEVFRSLEEQDLITIDGEHGEAYVKEITRPDSEYHPSNQEDSGVMTPDEDSPLVRLATPSHIASGMPKPRLYIDDGTLYAHSTQDGLGKRECGTIDVIGRYDHVYDEKNYY